MAISDEDIQKVREASDIVAIFGERVQLRQRGRDFWCCCPFHNEKTPSCKLDAANQLWHCFGCGEGGDVFSFVMKMDDVGFLDAVRTLAQRAHIELAEDRRGGASSSKKARLREVCAAADEFFHAQLMRSRDEGPQRARDYLAARGLGGEVPKRWHLGFAPGRGKLVRHLGSLGFTAEEMVGANVAVERDGSVRDRFFERVMFPIGDAQGVCIAFGGRVVGAGEPKYLNSQETALFHKSSVLYGLDKAKAGMTSTGTAIIVEGYTDVIALHEAGITNVAATLGTALTMQHVRLISRHASKRIVYLFDGDAAGQRAADRALGFIDESMTPEAGKARIELCAVTLPDDLDPADFVAKLGADELKRLVADAKPLIAYGLDRRLAEHDLASAEGRTRALAAALEVLAPIKGSLLAKDYAVQLSGRLKMREEDVLEALARTRAPRRYSDEVQGAGQGGAYGAGSQAGGQQAGAWQAGGPQGGWQGGSRGGSQGMPESGAVAGLQGGARQGAGTQGGARQGAVAQAQSSPVALPAAEVSRRRFERKIISLLAQNPALALERADVLAQTSWHDPANARLAAAVLDVLAHDPAVAPAQLVHEASGGDTRLAGALTSASLPGGADLAAEVGYLVEELEIGDMEESLAEMNAQLRGGGALGGEGELSGEEVEILFQAAADLQKTISAKRADHKPHID